MNIPNKNNKSLIWKVILLLQLLASGSDIYHMVTEPDILQPTHPVIITVFILIIDALVLWANVGVIVKKYFFSAFFWKSVVYAQILSVIIVLYYEFSAGGYSNSEMLIFANLALIILYVFLLPVAKYIYDIKKLNNLKQ